MLTYYAPLPRPMTMENTSSTASLQELDVYALSLIHRLLTEISEVLQEIDSILAEVRESLVQHQVPVGDHEYIIEIIKSGEAAEYLSNDPYDRDLKRAWINASESIAGGLQYAHGLSAAMSRYAENRNALEDD